MLIKLGIFALLLGLPLAAVGLHFRSRIAAFNARAVATEAVVVGHVPYVSTSGDAWRDMTEAQVQFRTRDGRVIDTKGPVRDRSEPPEPRLGSRVPLLYDPLDPAEVSLRGPRGQAGIAGSLLWMGVALSALGVAALVAQILSRLVAGRQS